MGENEVLPITDPDQDLINNRRATIAKLAEQKDIKGLNGYGIKVIEENQPTEDSCYETAFPRKLYPEDILLTVLTKWDQIEDPNPDDVAVYSDRKGRITHVGRVIKGGSVKSRWGQGGLLCEHSPLDVPLFAGIDVTVSWFKEPR